MQTALNRMSLQHYITKRLKKIVNAYRSWSLMKTNITGKGLSFQYRSKAPYTEKMNTHVPSGWWVRSTFAYGDVPDPLKVYWGKDCVEKFVKYIKEEVKWLYATFPQQPMTELPEVLKREHKAAQRCHICLNEPPNKKVRDHCHYMGLYWGGSSQ